MQNLIKHVYLLDNDKIKSDIEKLWRRYLRIINKKNCIWGEINDARAILYFLGFIFVEIIALGSLERRVALIKPKITLDEFLIAIDAKDKKILLKYRANNNFQKLKRFYLTVKDIKNRVNQDKSYLDEDAFNEKYIKLKPKNYF
jgi:hypothetical protein